MLQLHARLHFGVGRSRPAGNRLGHGLRTSRPVRQPRLGVCAFKDWFSGLVQQHKEPASQSQPASQVATQEQPISSQLQPQSMTPKIPPKRDFLEARQVSLFQLFDSSDYKFDIPTYQRPYAWRTKQIYELLQDFAKAYESRQEYFLGAIVATRAADGANVPYQLIDGQQRLTSLVLLLAFLHGWARQQGNDVLEGRFRRMLYLEADPLELGSNGRYRLRLRDADDEFFRGNILDAFLPQQYCLSGLAAAAAAGGAEAAASAAAAADSNGDGDVKPLENETWWRLYENATFLRSHLDKLVSEGLNLQDFAFHILRNCFVVMMVARDEGASFRIFSTLNGRGMDLSVVDKLKADLLAGELRPEERSHFADAWAEMESVLGRAAFHRVFDYMRDLAAVRDPRVRETSVLEYFTRRVDDPSAVKQVLQVALDYARLLLQLRQASWGWVSPDLAVLLAENPQEQSPSPSASQERLLTAEVADSGAVPAAASDSNQMRSDIVSAVVAQVVLEQPVAVPVPAVLGPEDERQLLEQLHQQHRQWVDGSGRLADVAAVAEVEVEAAPPVALVKEVVQKDEDTNDAVSVFRFDDVRPTATLDATAAATAAAGSDAATDAGGSGVVELGAVLSMSAAQAVGVVDDAGAAATAADEEEARAGGPGAGASFATSANALMMAVSLSDDGVALTNALTAAVDEEQEEVAVLAAAYGGAGDGDGARATSHTTTRIPEVEEERHLPEMEAPQAKAVLQSQPQPQQEAAMTAMEEVTVAMDGVAVEAEDLVAAERRRQAVLLAELDTRSRHLNLFTDEAWLPPLLEFFYQTEDLEARAAFMRGAEALQLLLELQGDPAAKAERWGTVSDSLLQRPFRPEEVLAALRLTDSERQAFRARLDSKDLYGTADQRTLRHLLVRCEPPSVCRSLTAAGSEGLIVERVAPQSAPEGSMWRKTRISSPCDPQSAWPEPWFSAALDAPVGSAEELPEAAVAAAAAASVSYEVKYWYDVQRLNWHGKLGNLVLLPATATSATSATADYDAKAALWRQAGVLSRLPGFTGPLVDKRGRYGRFRFCHDECRQRHSDMLEYLIAEFEL